MKHPLEQIYDFMSSGILIVHKVGHAKRYIVLEIESATRPIGQLVRDYRLYLNGMLIAEDRWGYNMLGRRDQPFPPVHIRLAAGTVVVTVDSERGDSAAKVGLTIEGRSIPFDSIDHEPAFKSIDELRAKRIEEAGQWFAYQNNLDTHEQLRKYREKFGPL